MSKNKKIKQINLTFRKSGLVSRLIHKPNLLSIKKLLTREKAEIIQTLKAKTPNSIYELSKILNRDFKSVHKDIWFLYNIGVVKFKLGLNGKRKSLKPILALQELKINLKL